MANGESTEDLINSVLRNCGENVDSDSPYRDTALEYLDRFHKAFHSGSTLFDINFGDVWTWAKEKHPNVLILKPAYRTGAISLTNGSPSGTFDTPPSEDLSGWFIKVDGRPEVFRIISNDSPFADFTIDSDYTDETGASLGFTAFKLDYDLDQVSSQKILRLIAPMAIYRSSDDSGSGFIHGLEFPAFRKKYPPRYVAEGYPAEFTEIKDVDGLKTVRFSSFPTVSTRVEYDLVAVPNALSDDPTSIPALPLEARNAIEYAATYKLMLDKDDDRADKYLALCQASLKALGASDRREHSDQSSRRGELTPRPEQLMRNRLPRNGIIYR